MNLILASQSPRRADLLRQLGLDFQILPSRAEEKLTTGSPATQAKRLASEKASEVAARLVARDPACKALVLGADTLVWLGNKALGKPASPRQAVAMLKALSGRSHKVVTGLALVPIGMTGVKSLVEAETTSVTFRRLSPAEIADYVRGGEPMDKAGAYGVQGRAGGFIPRIRGDYFNVMGLPLARLEAMLTRFRTAAM